MRLLLIEDEKVDGFKARADDYLGKPFHFQELLARNDWGMKTIILVPTAAQQWRCNGLKETAGTEFKMLAAADRSR